MRHVTHALKPYQARGENGVRSDFGYSVILALDREAYKAPQAEKHGQIYSGWGLPDSGH